MKQDSSVPPEVEEVTDYSGYPVKEKGDTIRQMKTEVREKSEGPFFGCMGK